MLPTNGRNEPETPVPESLPPLAGEPETRVLSWSETQGLIGEHGGEVVVMQVWNSWNEHKTADFAELVRLAKLFRDEPVFVTSLNADHGPEAEAPPEARQADIQQFAAKHGANFPHVVSSTVDEELAAELDEAWFPAVLIFDKTGTLRDRIFIPAGQPPTPLPYREQVIPRVRELLAEKSEAPSQPAAKMNQVSVQILDWQQTQKLVEQQKGKVVVLDLWSTNCPPCIREFPNLVELHKQMGPRVAAMSFNMDYTGLEKPEELKPMILEFLQEQNATFTNVMSNVSDEKLFETLKLGSIPAVYVYDKQGKFRKRFDVESGEEFTYEKDIVPFVKQLAAE